MQQLCIPLDTQEENNGESLQKGVILSLAWRLSL